MSVQTNFTGCEHINNYLCSENPNKEITALAYYERDIQLGFTLNDIFYNATNKLCLSKNSLEKLINNEFKSFVNRQTKEFLKKTEKTELKFDYQNFYKRKIKSSNYQLMIKKYNTLLKYKEADAHLGFYKALTLEDLGNLGF